MPYLNMLICFRLTWFLTPLSCLCAVLRCPDNSTIGTSLDKATANVTLAVNATDNTGVTRLNCSMPLSPTLLPLGHKDIACQAADAANNTVCVNVLVYVYVCTYVWMYVMLLHVSHVLTMCMHRLGVCSV